MYPSTKCQVNRMAKMLDVVAGVMLLLTGSAGLIAKLGILGFTEIPSELRYGWTFAMITTGIALWVMHTAIQACLNHAKQSATSREANYVR